MSRGSFRSDHRLLGTDLQNPPFSLEPHAQTDQRLCSDIWKVREYEISPHFSPANSSSSLALAFHGPY
ncbi:hypothetical protein SLE2022_259510 [Rubroshorea leprosula]